MLDIHFQYNGFLIGLFLLCSQVLYEVYIKKIHLFLILFVVQNQLLVGSILFTILLCFKHMFVVFAPVLGLFVLNTVFTNASSPIYELMLISYSCAKVLITAFIPFILKGQLHDIAYRLFPVQRGLLHSYWAPNFWALYASLDVFARRIFIYKPELYFILFKKTEIPVSNLCNGLVGEKSFSILPNITPFTTVVLIGLVHMVILMFKLKIH